MNGRVTLGVRELVAYLEGQMREHRAGFGTGDTFNSDILNNKIRARCENGPCDRHERRRDGGAQKGRLQMHFKSNDLLGWPIVSAL